MPDKGSGAGKVSLKTHLLVFASLLALVLVPGMFWHDVWFGRALDDAELEEYLNDETSARRMQHGLAQLGERIGRGDPEARRWYPRVMELAGHDQPEIRNLSAWLMGQDASAEAFRLSLGELLKDSNPLVRRNAALSLVRFGDDRGRPELRSMLRPWVVESPQAGQLRLLVEADDEIRSGSPVAEVEQGEVSVAVQVPVAGTAANLVEDGRRVDAGAELMVLLPDLGASLGGAPGPLSGGNGGGSGADRALSGRRRGKREHPQPGAPDPRSHSQEVNPAGGKDT